jgi:hypothetical protein
MMTIGNAPLFHGPCPVKVETMVQYYTLEQAAQILRATPDELKEMAKRNEVRAFQDRGTLRFRSQEINELARLRGIGSDPELQLGEGAAPPKSPAPKTGKHTTHAPGGAGAVNFDLGEESDEVPIGKEPAPGAGKSPGRVGKPPSSKGSTKSPPPKAASDSDVRLVMDGGDLDFQIAIDSDVSVAKDPASGPPKTPGKKSGVRPPEKGDSGVRIVPLDKSSDSDVKLDPDTDESESISHERPKTPSDSDIRLEASDNAPRPGSDDALVTEEIDLDAESRKAAEAGKAKPGKRPRSKVGPVLPTSSPYELSESDISVEAPKTPGKSPKSPGKAAKTPPKGPKTPAKKPKSPEDKEGETDSSSDFELTPLNESSSPLEAGSSGEVPIMTDDDEVSLGELTGAGGGSGINLREPVDSGISLEQGGSDEIEFELSLDAGHTPKPKPAAPPQVDSSSEFELSLDADSSPVTGDESDSEFELSLDADGSDPGLKAEGDSSSEFELTLDEEGSLAPADDGSPLAAEGEQDIFETDFEVPALDEESGSEAVALNEADTDLESSDFDLALNEEEASSEEGSESQVVALEDEDEADSGAATVARPRRAAASTAAGAAAADEGLADIEEDLEGEPEEEEEAAATAAAPAAAPAPAQWGVLPALVLFPCTLVLFVVGLMSFEMVQGLWGYHRGAKVSRLVIDPIARMFDDTLPKD